MLVEHAGAPEIPPASYLLAHPRGPVLPAPRPRPTSDVFAKLAKVKACPHWTREGCGCAYGRCLVGRGDAAGLVSHQDCFQCLGIA